MADELSIDSKALIFATLADVYLTSGMLDEAISILKDGLARNPNYTLAKIILGRAYYMKGETDEALKLLEAIYPEAKDSENENLFLGHCYKRLADFDKARKHYEATLKINPDNKDAKRELAGLGAAPAGVESKADEVKAAAPEKPAEVEAETTLEIQASDSSVPIKEVILPEGDISIVKETPEPEMVIQEPTLKINVPPPIPETIDKQEIEIVLPVKGEEAAEGKTGSEAAVSWVDTKNEAEAIQKPELIEEAEAPEKTEAPVGPEKKGAERPPEIVAAEALVSDEVKKRIEALASANAEAAKNEKAAEPQPETRDFAAEIKAVVESQTAAPKAEGSEPAGKEPPVEEKQPEPAPAAVEKEQEPEPPPLFAEEMKPSEKAPAAVEPTGTPFDRLEIPVGKLLSLKTVTAAFISSRDGLLIKNYAEKREDIEEISALIAAIYNEAFESFKYLDEGAVEKIIIEKNRETICVITAGESLLCVITKPEAKPGLIFVYARKIIDEIREVLG